MKKNKCHLVSLNTIGVPLAEGITKPPEYCLKGKEAPTFFSDGREFKCVCCSECCTCGG